MATRKYRVKDDDETILLTLEDILKCGCYAFNKTMTSSECDRLYQRVLKELRFLRNPTPTRKGE